MIRKMLVGATVVAGSLTAFALPAMAETGPHVYPELQDSQEIAQAICQGQVEHYGAWTDCKVHQLPDGKFQIVYWER